MSTFIPNDGPLAPDTVIPNLAFFPNLSVTHFRDIMKLLPSVPDARVEWELKKSVLATNRELENWRLAHEQNGVATLADVPSDVYGDTSALVSLYEIAVYSRAKAFLIDRTRDTDLTNEGVDLADTADAGVEVYFRRTREALAEILGRPTATIELI